jgi:hypothetical protein
MAARLMLRECGLSGSCDQEEEVLVGEIATLLAAGGARRTAASRRRQQGKRAFSSRGRQVHVMDRALGEWSAKARGRFVHGRLSDNLAFDDNDRATHAPVTLPQVALDEVTLCLRRPRTNGELAGALVVAPLPQFRVGARAARHATPSTLRARLQEWLASDDAAEWRASRQQLFGHIGGPAEEEGRAT